MFSWNKLLGRDDKFFDLLEASALEAKTTAETLTEFISFCDRVHENKSLDKFTESKRRDKQITQSITEELCRTFVTPLEREDIEALSNSLYKIPKTVLKVAERLMICPPALRSEETLKKQAGLLGQATEIVYQMVRHLRPGSSLYKVREMNDQLQQLEGEADRLVTEVLRELCQGKRQALDVIILKDIFELLEKAIDRCRDAGNTVFQTILKNS
ncbi:MAG: DUF47 family protein [Methylacidiphilales bacterium]|nr:DUF47 family protein [Candidatus Methylacidiphilales bacterium]